MDISKLVMEFIDLICQMLFISYSLYTMAHINMYIDSKITKGE